MTCASCAQTVEKATQKLSGVKIANVNFATEKMSIQFDEASLSEADIQKAVSDAGYAAIPNTVRKTFNLEGMTCASCAQTIEKATHKLTGVNTSSVNLATEKMVVEYDPSRLNISDITQAVSDSGYEAHEERATADTVDLDQEKKQNEIKSLWKRFLISAIFTAPLLYIAMGHLVNAPLPAFIDPMMNPENFAIIQLLLTLPVVVVNKKIYQTGFKALFKGHPNMDSLIALGTSAAFLYGVFATVMIFLGEASYANELYYETAAVILALIVLGKYLETLTKGKTSEAIKKLMGLAPKTALVVRRRARI